MVDASQIQDHAEVIGADGVYVGSVEGVEGGVVRFSADADVAVAFAFGEA